MCLDEIRNKMGFYIHIYIMTQLCPETGKPFYYGPNFEKIYDIPEIVVPEQYRRFLSEKNSIYHAYMSDNNYYDSVDMVHDTFPTWQQVKNLYPDAEEEYEWTEQDHNLFNEAIKWFASQPIGYIIHWG